MEAQSMKQRWDDRVLNDILAKIPPEIQYDREKVRAKFQECQTMEDLTKPDGFLREIFKGTIERMLKAEQEAHLGYEPYRKKGTEQENSRNGFSKKTLKTSTGPVEIKVPRDRLGTFEPKAVPKHQGFDPTFEKQITGMYARGMTVRDIQFQLETFYGADVWPAYISKVTDKVLEGITEWQSRPLEDVYAVVFLDAIFFKIRQDGKVISKAAYTAMGIDLEGKVDVLGLWIAETEGAHFWLSVLTELQSRGVRDILIACIDGLKGFPEAIQTIFPKTLVQLCVVHQIRNSLRYVASKYHKEFIADLKLVYRAESREIAEANLQKLEEKWQSRYPSATTCWRANWANLSTYFSFPQEIRRMIYTTNGVEALHRQFRKVTKAKAVFPTDDALKKMLYLATLDLKGSFRSKQGWPQMLGQLALIFQERVPQTAWM
jgi:transposase-like protein